MSELDIRLTTLEEVDTIRFSDSSTIAIDSDDSLYFDVETLYGFITIETCELNNLIRALKKLQEIL